jgi:hypothetical protein
MLTQLPRGKCGCVDVPIAGAGEARTRSPPNKEPPEQGAHSQTPPSHGPRGPQQAQRPEDR